MAKRSGRVRVREVEEGVEVAGMKRSKRVSVKGPELKKKQGVEGLKGLGVRKEVKLKQGVDSLRKKAKQKDAQEERLGLGAFWKR